jgi:hypothetical protein
MYKIDIMLEALGTIPLLTPCDPLDSPIIAWKIPLLFLNPSYLLGILLC